ncbi:MAG TPA: acyl-CoA dehydrogenase family protein, partial [Acidimicrobiales bacterium]|nr:acyl-CoA dehydrogenase family protein [Acidimicrobiales bacterium]
MDFALSDEHEAFRAVVRAFATDTIAPHAADWDRDHTFPLDAVRTMGDLGLFGLVCPEEWGGAGGDFASLCVAIEEIGRVDQSMGITLSAAVGLGINPILRFGTRPQQDEWLPDLAAGRALAAFALTEPDTGSDTAAIRTRARYDEAEDEWVIDGTKAFVTNSGTPITSLVTVAARSDGDGTSTIIVPAASPGLLIEPAYRKLGWHASDTHGVVLEGCRVPGANLLGARGAGVRNFLEVLDDGRIAIAALAIGCSTACL